MGQLGETDMPSDSHSDNDQRPASQVEKLLNALDEVQDAVNRLAAESRPADQPIADDVSAVEPFSREDARADAPHPQSLSPISDTETAID